jgi:hypothetical protein
METYDVVAKCKTPKCEGMLRFGTTTADSLNALVKQLHNFSTQQATCPVCQQSASYSFQDYLATPLDQPDE